MTFLMLDFLDRVADLHAILLHFSRTMIHGQSLARVPVPGGLDVEVLYSHTFCCTKDPNFLIRWNSCSRTCLCRARMAG